MTIDTPTRMGAASAPDASAQRVLRVLRAAAVWSTIEHRPLACLSAMALDVTTLQPKARGTCNWATLDAKPWFQLPMPRLPHAWV